MGKQVYLSDKEIYWLTLVLGNMGDLDDPKEEELKNQIYDKVSK